jgi:hypothetical protein
MPLATFLACIEHYYLQPTRYISVEGQLAIFLKIVAETRPTVWHKKVFNGAAAHWHNPPCLKQSSRRDDRPLQIVKKLDDSQPTPLG